MLYETDLSAQKRVVPFPFPVKRFGSTVGEQRKAYDFYFTDKFEVCIRISSGEEEFAVDRIDGNVYRTRFPHVLIKYPFRPITYALPYPRNSFHFSYSLKSLEAMRAQKILPEEIAWEIELSGEITELIRRLTDYQNHSLEYGVADRVDVACFQLLQELIFMRKKPKTDHECNHDRIMAIASALKFHFNREMDLEALAREHGMSRRTFFRYWRMYFPETPAEYVRNIKLEEAARQLRETNHRIGEITEFLNFSDSAYLSKLFKERYGMTPLRYRSHCFAEESGAAGRSSEIKA